MINSRPAREVEQWESLRMRLRTSLGAELRERIQAAQPVLGSPDFDAILAGILEGDGV